MWQIPRIITSRRTLSKPIVNAPLTGHSPRLHGIVVAGHTKIVFGQVKEFGDLGSCRLNRAQFVRAARLEHTLFSVPIPVEAEPRMGHPICRSLNFGVLPTLATVGGYLNPADGSTTGPSQSADFVESTAGQLLSPGRICDYRFRSNLITQRRGSWVRPNMPVIVISHVELVHHLDSPQPFRMINSFKAGNHQPERETLLWT